MASETRVTGDQDDGVVPAGGRPATAAAPGSTAPAAPPGPDAPAAQPPAAAPPDAARPDVARPDGRGHNRRAPDGVRDGHRARRGTTEPGDGAGTPVRAAGIRPRRRVWLWPALLTLVITSVGAGNAEPWRDELATWSAADRPLGELPRLAAHIDGVSAPYYLFMHAWIRLFGDSPVALRVPSILALTAAAALTAVLGRRLFGDRVGLTAGLILAVLPSTSRYAQEARPYAFVTGFAVAATLLLVRALDRPTGRRWSGYAAALVGLGLTHLIAVTLVAGHAVAVAAVLRAANPRRDGRGAAAAGWLGAVLAAAVLLVPLALLARGQHAEQLAWAATPGWGTLPDLPGSVLVSAPVGGMLLGLAALGCATRGRWGLALAASVLLPAALLFVAGRVTPLFVPRYLVFTVPFAAVLAAAALARARLAAALAITAVLALLGAPDQRDLRRTHESPRSAPRAYAAAAGIIGANLRPGDGIVYPSRTSPALLDTSVSYYLRDRAPRDVLATRTAVQRGSLFATECADPGRCLSGVDRVWVLTQGNRSDPVQDMSPTKAAALRNGYRITGLWTVPGLTVALLDRSATGLR